MGGIYNVCHFDGLRWHDIYIQSFKKINSGVQAVVRLYLRNLRGCNVDNTDGRDS
jgi:hypothetical protein